MAFIVQMNTVTEVDVVGIKKQPDKRGGLLELLPLWTYIKSPFEAQSTAWATYLVV
jgi:hypothetical protein